MNTFNLEQALKSIGKAAFVELFEYVDKDIDYTSAKGSIKDVVWVDHFRTRYSSSRSIFANGLEVEALNIIINSRVDIKSKEKAKLLLKNYIQPSTIYNEVTDYESNDATYQQKNVNIERFVVKGKDKIKFDMDYNEINSNFTFRLLTQERYNKKLQHAYTPRIFNNLDIGFDDIISQQISKTYTYCYINDEYVKVYISDIKQLKFNKEQLLGKVGKDMFELYFNIDDNFYPLANYIRKFGDISLGHMKSMYRIIEELDGTLPAMNEIYKLSLSYPKNKNGRTINLREITGEIISNIDLDELKREILRIEDFIELQLIPLRVNISMGRN